MARLFAPTMPVILEHEHYGASKARGAWGDGSLVLKAVEDYRASYLSIHWWPRVELEECRDLIDRINLRLGYRLQLREAQWPAKVVLGRPFTIASQWANAGVAPCYPGGFVAWTLKDEKDGIVAVLVDESRDVGDLQTAPPGEAQAQPFSGAFTLCREVAGALQTVRAAPNTAPGTYGVYVSVGRRDGTPVIALPLEGDDGHRRYRLGAIEVTGPQGQFALEVKSVALEEGAINADLVWTIREALPAATEPFGHVEQDGELVGFGRVEGADPAAFRTPGVVRARMVFPIPEDLRGEALVGAGLWAPGETDLPLERIRPDGDPAQRRVTLGTLRVDREGRAALTRP